MTLFRLRSIDRCVIDLRRSILLTRDIVVYRRRQLLHDNGDQPRKRNRLYRGAIVGSGPAAFYCAEALYRYFPAADRVTLDVFERSPVPYGLVRFGVAPDHPDLKKCIGGFERMIERAGVGKGFRYFGNVSIGKDVRIEELSRAYNFVVLAYGAESDRKLGIPGEDDASNCFSARTFVNWYNGAPEAARTRVDLRPGPEPEPEPPEPEPSEGFDTAVVFGHGNVALDVARTLLTPVDVLVKTDIAEHALRELRRSRIRRCVLIGRRGPLQVAFTTAELRQMIHQLVPKFDPRDFADLQSRLPHLERARKRLTALMYDTAMKPTTNIDIDVDDRRRSRSWELKFLRSPVRILKSPSTGAVEGVELAINRLAAVETSDSSGGRQVIAVDTGEREIVKCGLLLYSIGYKTLNIDPDTIPFDDQRGHVVRTDGQGRVVAVAANDDRSSSSIDNLYACGWCSRGPVGVLATTQNHAKAVAETIRKDAAEGKFDEENDNSSIDIENLLRQRGIRYVTWDGWLKIDRYEKLRGEKVGKPREKIVDKEELLAIAFGP